MGKRKSQQWGRVGGVAGGGDTFARGGVGGGGGGGDAGRVGGWPIPGRSYQGGIQGRIRGRQETITVTV